MSSRTIRLEDVNAELLSLISETGNAWIVGNNFHLVVHPSKDSVGLQIGIENWFPNLEDSLLIAIADKAISDLALSDYKLGEVYIFDKNRWIELDVGDVTESVLINVVHTILANLLDLTKEEEVLFLYC